jgi:hypothetical protein
MLSVPVTVLALIVRVVVFLTAAVEMDSILVVPTVYNVTSEAKYCEKCGESFLVTTTDVMGQS